MSDLLRSQLTIFFVMGCCGIAAGLCYELFKNFSRIKRLNRFWNVAAELSCFCVIGVLISEAFFYCDNGKITMTGIGSFLVGLWLWKKVFCGILTLTEEEHGEEERRSKRI